MGLKNSLKRDERRRPTLPLAGRAALSSFFSSFFSSAYGKKHESYDQSESIGVTDLRLLRRLGGDSEGSSSLSGSLGGGLGGNSSLTRKNHLENRTIGHMKITYVSFTASAGVSSAAGAGGSLSRSSFLLGSFLFGGLRGSSRGRGVGLWVILSASHEIYRKVRTHLFLLLGCLLFDLLVNLDLVPLEGSEQFREQAGALVFLRLFMFGIRLGGFCGSGRSLSGCRGGLSSRSFSSGGGSLSLISMWDVRSRTCQY